MDPFLSSDDYDEQAHQLYNEGRYDEALGLLREGAALYPNAIEIHVGMAYAYLAREEYAWALRSFELALALDMTHEDALAGQGEILLKLGRQASGLNAFQQVLTLGFKEDADLMLQIGRALFREGLLHHAQRFFEYAVAARPDSPDAAACVGYAAHRLGDEGTALYWLRRALEIDTQYSEARIYLSNMLYDRGESEAALFQLERTLPDDHYDELALWRYIELKKTLYRLRDDDPELTPWLARLGEVAGEPDTVDMTELQAMQKRPGTGEHHQVATLSGRLFRGTWEEILHEMKAADREWSAASLQEYMLDLARRGATETGVVIPVTDAEAFIKGSAAAGVVRIIQ
jgi:tetratricopeptide (TPR) repeat protein